MPTVPTHALVTTTLFTWLAREHRSAWLLAAGIIVAMLPDVDVVGFALGVRYGDLLGHRGLSHSLAFAAVVATGVLLAIGPTPRRAAVWWFLFLCTASHGVLDAATDGGLGVAFLSPFSNERYFWPWRPIRVAPIGLTRIFSERGLSVVQTEMVWIWLPCALVMLARYARYARYARFGRPSPDENPIARGR
jgi:inner membrane protein